MPSSDIAAASGDHRPTPPGEKSPADEAGDPCLTGGGLRIGGVATESRRTVTLRARPLAMRDGCA